MDSNIIDDKFDGILPEFGELQYGYIGNGQLNWRDIHVGLSNDDPLVGGFEISYALWGYDPDAVNITFFIGARPS